jgi:hypothetical protein
MPHLTIEDIKYAVKVAGAIGSLVAFGIAVSTYYRTERWKRAEFLAKEMKEFFATPRVQRAMLLIDWGKRRIQLLEDLPAPEAIVTVDRAMQVRGLRPHVLVVGDGSDDETMATSDVTGPDRFTHAEAAIRDCYDAFLDGLERFASYTKTGLIDVASLRPYIGYWVDDIAAPTTNRDDAAWCAALLTYISYYRFTGVLWLFKEFGRDIGPGSDIYKSFLRGMSDQVLAAALAKTVGLEYSLFDPPRDS